MPVRRRISTAAQAQKARRSSPLRSRRLPVAGSSAHRWLPDFRGALGPAQDLAVGGEFLARAGCRRCGEQPRSAGAAVLGCRDQGGQHGETLARTSLNAQGYEIRVANDGETALEIVKDFAPDLVTTDLAMPNMNGIELCLPDCAKCRKSPFWSFRCAAKSAARLRRSTPAPMTM